MVEEIVPPTGLVKSAVKVTHNNDRKHYVIAIDDAKEGAAIWNLDPFFKARVGDSNATLSVVWYHQGRLRNFNNVGEAKPFKNPALWKHRIWKMIVYSTTIADVFC